MLHRWHFLYLKQSIPMTCYFEPRGLKLKPLVHQWSVVPLYLLIKVIFFMTLSYIEVLLGLFSMPPWFILKYPTMLTTLACTILLCHWELVERILCHLKGAGNHGLLFQCPQDLSLYGYVDGDWASDLDDCKFTSNFCVFFGGNLTSWGSKKQSIISRSST